MRCLGAAGAKVCTWKQIVLGSGCNLYNEWQRLYRGQMASHVQQHMAAIWQNRALGPGHPRRLAPSQERRKGTMLGADSCSEPACRGIAARRCNLG